MTAEFGTCRCGEAAIVRLNTVPLCRAHFADALKGVEKIREMLRDELRRRGARCGESQPVACDALLPCAIHGWGSV